MKEHKTNITSIEKITPSVYHVVLANPGVSFLPGQFISILLEHEGREIRRPYSIASKDQKTIDLCIKDVGGPASLFFRNAKVGDSIRFVGPIGKFIMPTGDIIFISTGVGIAPFRSMIAHAKERQTMLIAGYRKKEDILYDQEFRSYHNNFKYNVCLSQSEEELFPRGYVQDLLDKIPSDFNGHFMICGVLPMIQNVTKKLIEKGFKKEQIITERFT